MMTLTIDLSRIIFPIAVGLFMVVALAVPILQLKWRTGKWALTAIRSKSRAEKIVSFFLISSIIAVGVWSYLYASKGPEALGVWSPPSAVIWIGWFVAFCGMFTVAAAQQNMGGSWRIGIEDEKTELVTTGLFRLSRNPIYTGMLTTLAGIFIVSPAIPLGVIVLLATTVIEIQTRREEVHLLATHGADFRDWAARTGRFLPFLGRLR